MLFAAPWTSFPAFTGNVHIGDNNQDRTQLKLPANGVTVAIYAVSFHYGGKCTYIE